TASFQVYFSLRCQDARADGNASTMQLRHARSMIATARELLAEREGWRLVGLGHGHQVNSSDLALLQEFVDPARVILAHNDLALPRPRPYAIHLDIRPGSLASYSLADQAALLPDADLTVNDHVWHLYQWA